MAVEVLSLSLSLSLSLFVCLAGVFNLYSTFFFFLTIVVNLYNTGFVFTGFQSVQYWFFSPIYPLLLIYTVLVFVFIDFSICIVLDFFPPI
jgi:hypothetical protein